MIKRPPLAKFVESEHPRANDGKFTGSGGAPSFRVAPLGEPSPAPRRSLTRGESWQRVGAKLPSLPVAYTGSTKREPAVDSWKALSVKFQAPKALTPQEHQATLGQLKQIIQQNRDGAIAKAKETRRNVAVHGIKDFYTLKRRTGALVLDPETPRGAVNRAYNLAAMRALHGFGVVDFDYKLSDAQKAELAPLEPFIRYAERRLGSAMRGGDMKGKTRPYRSEFGIPFADRRGVGVSVLRSRRMGLPVDRGPPKLRVRPNQQIIKLGDGALPLAKAFNASQARDQSGKWTGGGAADAPLATGQVRRFHVTSSDNVKSIRQSGIQPRHSRSFSVFSWPTLDQAKQYAGGDKAIVEFRHAAKNYENNPLGTYQPVPRANILRVHAPLWPRMLLRGLKKRAPLAKFDEAAHPRDEDGQFAAKPGHDARGAGKLASQIGGALGRSIGELHGSKTAVVVGLGGAITGKVLGAKTAERRATRRAGLAAWRTRRRNQRETPNAQPAAG